MKNFILIFFTTAILSIGLTPLRTAGAAFNCDEESLVYSSIAPPASEEPSFGDEFSSEQHPLCDDLKTPNTFYQTKRLSPSSQASDNYENVSSTDLPPTEHPIERKCSKGVSTYSGIFLGVVVALYSGVAVFDLSSSLLLAVAMGSSIGIIAGFSFTYYAWKGLNYLFKS